MQNELVTIDKTEDGLSCLKKNIDVFNRHASDYSERTIKILVRTWYWVYDVRKGVFGPSKFIAFENMNFDRYEQHANAPYSRIFDGNPARIAIEKLLDQDFEPNTKLHGKLISWAEDILDEPQPLKNVTADKWKFIEI